MKTFNKAIAATLITAASGVAVASQSCAPTAPVERHLNQQGYALLSETVMGILGEGGVSAQGTGQFWLTPDSLTLITFKNNGLTCLVALIENPVGAGI